MSEPVYSFGAWVRLRRQALVLTRDELARRVGCAEVTIRKIESDERRPSAQVAELLARQLAVPAEQHELFVRVARGIETVERLPPAAGITLVATLTSDAPARASRPTTNLPLAPNALIGRDGDLAAIDGMLAGGARLVTLTGAGGSGKTRLALEVGRKRKERYGDGVWFVDLSNSHTGEMLINAIAQALDVPESLNRSLHDGIIEWIRHRHILLILDNCEQILSRSAELAAEFLRIGADVQILATSRIPLRIAAEREYGVLPLSVPPPQSAHSAESLRQYAAAVLFVERAQAIVQGFTLNDANASAIASICHHLDGLPLALELAAARVRLFSPHELSERLHALGALPLLASGARDLPRRQRTMRTVIDWSYALLTPAQQVLFAQLSVFAGGWTLKAAEVVCSVENDEVAAELEALVEQCLVRTTDTVVGRRYVMLETIREYAGERLDECGTRDMLRHRHACFYAELAERADQHLHGAAQLDWLAGLDHEAANLRAALEWAEHLPQRHEARTVGLQLASALGYYWFLRGHVDQQAYWLERDWTFDTSLDARQRLRALFHLVSHHHFLGNYLRAFELETTIGVPLARATGDAHLLAALLLSAFWGNEQANRADTAEALTLAQSIGNTWLEIYAHTRAWYQNETSVSGRVYEEVLQRARHLGDRWLLANCLLTLASNQSAAGLHERALVLLEEAALNLNQLRHGFSLGTVAQHRAHIMWACGNVDAAIEATQERFRNDDAIGNTKGAIWSLQELSDYYDLTGQFSQAEAALHQARQRNLSSGEFLLEDRAALWRGKLDIFEQHILYLRSRPDLNYSVIEGNPVADELYAQLTFARGELEEAAVVSRRLWRNIQAAPIQRHDALWALLLGQIAAWQGQETEARHYFEVERRHAQQSNHVPNLAEIELSYARALTALHHPDEASQHLVDAIRLYRKIRILYQLAECFTLAATICVANQAPIVAARLWGAAEALREHIGSRMWPVFRSEHDTHVAATRAQLGDATFDAAWQAGRALSWEQAADEALVWLEGQAGGQLSAWQR